MPCWRESPRAIRCSWSRHRDRRSPTTTGVGGAPALAALRLPTWKTRRRPQGGATIPTEHERTALVPASRLLEVAGVLSDGAARLHAQLGHLPLAQRKAVLDALLGQVGDVVEAWSKLVQAVVDVETTGEAPDPRPSRGPAVSGATLAGSATGVSSSMSRSSAAPDLTHPQPALRPDHLVSMPNHADEDAHGNGSDEPQGPLLTAYRAPEESVPPAGDGGTRDELTGVLNRQDGLVAVARELERARSNGLRFVVGYLNIDGLRQVNDTSGQRAGDELLRKVAAALRATLRSHDVILRPAGDEFLFSLPGADLAVAERRLNEVGAILGQEAPGASVTVGFAQLREGESLGQLVARADDALVEARSRRGRSRSR